MTIRCCMTVDGNRVSGKRIKQRWWYNCCKRKFHFNPFTGGKNEAEGAILGTPKNDMEIKSTQVNSIMRISIFRGLKLYSYCTNVT